jgi:hypothetical protein
MQSYQTGRLALLVAAVATADGFANTAEAWTVKAPRRRLADRGARPRPAYYADPEWRELARRVEHIFTGRSEIYRPDLTLREIAELWTAGRNTAAWSETVCSIICVSPYDRLRVFLHPQPVEPQPSAPARA